jgi:hypothetical protein
LITNDPIAVFPNPLKGRHLGREYLVHQSAFSIPVIFEGGGGEIRFRLESVIKTSLIDAGPIADVVDAD